MNKLLIMALCAGGLLMSSCSSDEKVDAPRNTAEITFRATPNKLARADYDVNNGNLKSIKVWGYNKDKTAGSNYQGALVFDGTTVTGSVGTGLWSYSPAVYWIKNSDYTFSALNEGTLTFPSPLAGFGTTSFTQVDGKKDLVWATQTATTGADISAAPGTVDFTFNHALCRVKFKIGWNDPNPAYSISIRDLKLDGTPNTGSFTLANPAPGTWDNTSGAFTAVYDNALESEYRYLIPGDYQTDKLSASFIVTLYQNSVPQRDYFHQGANAHAIAANLVQGHSYVITATLTANGGDPDNPTPSIDPDNTLYPIQFRVVDVTNFNDPDEPLGW